MSVGHGKKLVYSTVLNVGTACQIHYGDNAINRVINNYKIAKLAYIPE